MDARIETGSYILRSLVNDVALSADDGDEDVHITCVELWGKWIESFFGHLTMWRG
jgi:hypothetical protein